MAKPMTITLEPTREMRRVNGVPARLFLGVTSGGVACTVYVAAIEVGPDDKDAFEAELGGGAFGPGSVARTVEPPRDPGLN